MNPFREQLAELEHTQWIDWSKTIAHNENLSGERLKRWRKLWVPYFELTEEEKNSDRECADKVLLIFYQHISKMRHGTDGNHVKEICEKCKLKWLECKTDPRECELK